MAKNNFIITFMSCALVLASTVLFARQTGTPSQTATFETKWMQDNLGITQAQGKKVYNIINHFAQLDQAKDSNNTANSRSKDADIRAVLTAEQYRSYHQKLNDMHQQEMQALQQTGK